MNVFLKIIINDRVQTGKDINNIITKRFINLLFFPEYMEIKVVEKSKKKIIFDVVGVDHTFSNALKKELWNDKSIKISAYSIAHPLIGIPRFIVETDDKDPEKALLDAVKRLQKKNEQFLEGAKKLKV
jgi:DNA-directed RNA polymerase subunit L